MNIYVSNLSYNLEEPELKSIFSEYGVVNSVKIVKDKMTGRGKGFGFIEMDDDNEGLAAIEKLNGKEVEGRRLMVSKARPPKPRTSF